MIEVSEKMLCVRVTAPSRIVSRSDGPGAFLYQGETMPVSMVSQNLLDEISSGGKASRSLEIVELDVEATKDAGIVETASPVNGDEADPNHRHQRVDPMFTPVGKKVEDVMVYLKETTPEEVERVQELEKSNTERQGGASKTIASYTPPEAT